MVQCPSCGSSELERARFCSACGAAILAHDALTVEATAGTVGTSPRKDKERNPTSNRSGASRPESWAGLAVDGRFLPGQLLGGRYRIVALLGKGGMGEVYRADDLVLGQPVALKFLPEAASSNPELLARFHSEVRIARRVTHANVCRVYDVGEAEGQTFLSMEYVDGEDLSSLLRRIGRLPPDKALEIARQLSAGLAAAHREGVLHRDLKPSNIMLDGRGRAVITDFGLAGLADQILGAEVRSGTPAYMSPEQLAGREVTPRSDLYALGLVLYEVVTGRRAFDGQARREPGTAASQRPPSAPSSWVKDLDPAIERVILRCLEPDPAARPASALAVAAALPGGDPLAAALAAGETPSPEIVAAAGDREGIRPGMAAAALALVMVGLVICTLAGVKLSGLALMPQPLPPEALRVKAGEVIRALGYTDQAVDQSGQWDYQTEFTDYVVSHEGPRPDWARILSERPQVLVYAYRQSPVYLDPQGFDGLSLTPGVVEFDDPPAIQSGMINLVLDSQGRLAYFQAIPKEHEANSSPTAAPDWTPLFRAAGLDAARLRPAAPEWVGLGAFDARAAWTGTWPDSGRPLRVEAAAWHSKPVYFSLIGPWTSPTRMPHEDETAGQHASQTIEVVLAVLLLVSGAWIARRNYAQGRSDVRAALQLFVAVLVLELVIWLVRNHFVPTLATFGHFVLAASTGLFLATAIGILYLALDPYVRRHWPQAIVSWSRLTTGHLRDPLVGRDVLWGVALGVSWSVIIALDFLWLKRAGDTPQLPSQALLVGGRQAAGVWLVNVVQCILGSLQFFFIMFILRAILRNRWAAAAVFVAIFTAINTLRTPHPAMIGPMWVIVYAIAAYAVSRFGLITLTVAIFAANLLPNLPYTLDFSNWYATSVLALVLSFAAIAAWGFHTALAGQKLLREDLFD